MGLPELGPPTDGAAGMSFLLAPIANRGERAGYILLGEKEGGQEFTHEDEETLVLFAAQAALAIANAGRHREEQQARADLETLVDTCPVGVVVFDAVTGTPKSFNREARRIVDSLRNPGQSPEDLLEELTFRRSDGAEVSLREFPMAELLGAAEKVRAEEVVISVPDGRSVTLLVNATPIISGEGAVRSMVVTLQDLADLEEPERMRVDFLAMVTHELRMPLTSIKGSATTIMDAAPELDPAGCASSSGSWETRPTT
jgi:nitrogen fixation/metabolism regulation signal transduction histidine kinase